MLQTPEGISSIATVTELRSQTSTVIDQAEKANQGVLIVKNNEAYAVVLSYDRYKELVNQAAS